MLKKNISAIDIKFLSADARKSFFAILLIIILIILNVTAGFIYGKAFASVVYFEKANKALGKAGGLNQSQNYLIRAINLKNDALYYRALSAVNLAILGEIIQKKEITNEEKSQAEFALSQTLAAGNAAVALDMTSYQSWINLGNIYRALVPYGVKNAYENSAQSYVRASEANPRDPSIYLALANLELAHKNTEAARKYLSHAIERKFNYTEALALLSTIELEAGNLAEAINQAEKAAKSAPYDPSLLFQLGLLEYNGGFYGKAAVSLKNATLIKPDYLNAHYFLGLAYDKLDQKEMALAEFEYLAEALPENSEIAGILENLKNGLPALQKKANTGGKNSKGR